MEGGVSMGFWQLVWWLVTTLGVTISRAIQMAQNGYW